MPIGPGKYDYLATYVRREANALGVIVVVFDGKYGNGFSVQAPPDITLTLPTLLRTIANQIEASFAKGKL